MMRQQWKQVTECAGGWTIVERVVMCCLFDEVKSHAQVHNLCLDTNGKSRSEGSWLASRGRIPSRPPI